jgi:hypothetical protein
MYKAIYKIQSDTIDKATQEIFTPFIDCYHIHSVSIYINGIAYEQDVDFVFIKHKTKCFCGFQIEKTDTIICDINYFYIQPNNIDVLGFIVDTSFTNAAKSKEIISKHYIEGQFSLDNGLYKNAVLNFGTTLEGILNKSLTKKDLEYLINNYVGNANQDSMHFIRKLRNKVHPNRISATADISRQEAVEARNKLEIILNSI